MDVFALVLVSGSVGLSLFPLQVDSIYPNNPDEKTSMFFKDIADAINAKDSEVRSLCLGAL